MRLNIVWLIECNDFDIGCKYVLSIVKSLCLGKNLFKIVRFVSKHVMGDNYCNIEIWLGGYMDFSVY